jgi:hypothetical protein
MKASEYIAELQELIAEFGDRTLVVEDGDAEVCEAGVSFRDKFGPLVGVFVVDQLVGPTNG